MEYSGEMGGLIGAINPAVDDGATALKQLHLPVDASPSTEVELHVLWLLVLVPGNKGWGGSLESVEHLSLVADRGVVGEIEDSDDAGDDGRFGGLAGIRRGAGTASG